jgi:hypothetical protein
MSSRIVQTTAAAAAILALLAPLFVIHLPTDRAWLRVSLDASHGPIFAAVAVILCAWLSSRVTHHEPVSWPDWPRCGQAFALTIVTGIVIEYLQSLQRRLPSSFDVATDAAGAAAGLAVWSLLTRSRGVGPPGRDRRMAWALVAIALAGITFVAWRPLHAVVAYANRAASFPSIAHFRSAQDLYFVTTNGKAAELVALPAPWAQREGERALRLTYDAKHAPAVQVVEPSPDWRGYSVIAADLTNAGDTEVRLTFRIHDAAHDWSHEDRMNLPLVLAPGTRTTVRVALAEVQAAPASRPMDLSRIANVMLFGAPAQPPGEIYVSRLWLE